MAGIAATTSTEWAPDEGTRNRILVTNPEVLYGFPNRFEASSCVDLACCRQKL
jgi:LDH2 family malate/lactate/ureidoglycolate dehydrogenase